MRIDTVGDGIAWSCESLIQLGAAVQTAAGKKDKTLSTLERIANSLWQCKASRPEYQSVLLGQPFSVPERFPSLESQRTALNPQEKEKHFVVTAVIEPELPGSPVVSVEIEAVYSKHARIIGWRELTDVAQWRRGWV
jgi:tryptophan-rich hypothetical protein